MKYLSVIIPFYNAADTLEKAVMSCLDERVLDDIEVILVNDGSKDNSLELAREFEKKYTQSVYVIDKPNGGKGSCMNKGISMATGVYLRELDSDDFFLEGSVYQLLLKLRTIDVDVIHTNFLEFYSDTNKTIITTLQGCEYDKIINLRKFSLPGYDYAKYRMHSLTYKTDFIRRIGFSQTEGVSYTDSEYVYYPLICANSIVCYDIVLYCYVLGISGQSVSVESMIRKFSHRWPLLDRFLSDKQYIKGNKSAIDIRTHTILAISRPIITIYLSHFDYNLEIERKIRSFIECLKDQDNSVYNETIKNFGNSRIYVYIWYIWAKGFFYIRNVLRRKK